MAIKRQTSGSGKSRTLAHLLCRFHHAAICIFRSDVRIVADRQVPREDDVGSCRKRIRRKIPGRSTSRCQDLGRHHRRQGTGECADERPGRGAERAVKDPPEDVLELIPSLKRLSKDLEEELRTGALEVKLEPRGLAVSLRQNAFFPSGTDVIARNTYPTLEKLANVIRSLPNPVQLEGTHGRRADS